MNGECRLVSVKEAASLLLEADDIFIISHMKPDGDTFGCGFAFLYGLRALGKRVHIACSDGFPPRYDFLYEGAAPGHQPAFSPRFVLAVDIASEQLFGEHTACYAACVDLCIDHHPSNSRYASHLLLDTAAAATAELAASVLAALGVPLTKQIAACLYTGLATDTGCFRYANTRAATLRLAADLLDTGMDGYAINKRMFETKSAGRVELEKIVLQTLEYQFDGKCALLVVTREMQEKTGVPEEDLEGISSIPRQIEGVEIGITMKEKRENQYRVSVRCSKKYDASRFCAQFGGGGHPRAAGCMIAAPLEAAKLMLLSAAGAAIAETED